MMWIGFSSFILRMIAARVVDLPDPVGPVSRTMPFLSCAISLSCAGSPRSATVGIWFGMTRRTMLWLPRCEKTFTRKRVRLARLYDRSVDPVRRSFSARSRLPWRSRSAMNSVW